MARMLTLNTKGPDVADLQSRLNCRSPTRLPRLSEDKDYGVRTMARVMEFQFRQGLSVDGAVGPKTAAVVSAGPATCTQPTPPKGRCILVDLINRRLLAFDDGAERLRVTPIMGGDVADPSTRGVFQMSSRRLRHHTSGKFPFPPDNMQFALFYNLGEAIHLGPPNEPSHGCIHVGSPHAEHVFSFAGLHDVLVIVVKRTR